MKYVFAIAFLLLTACAHVDTGQTDYRIADAPSIPINRDGAPINTSDKNAKYCPSGVTEKCDPILPARVVRRYMPDPETGWRAFRDQQIYSIEIEQGVIGSNILEGKVLGHQFGSKGEIAILANVFEFAADADTANVKRFLNGEELVKATDDPSDVELKLVYFSDDVRREQAFNFSNIPLRQRSTYGGGTVGIQIVVMEVDAQAAPVASLLKTLARFGQQLMPVPGEAKDMLFDLGESLLTGSQDDKLLEYRFALSASENPDDDRAFQATFAPGRYVIRRLQDRKAEMAWEDLRLDHNTGRLLKGAPTGLLTPVTEDLYLVLNIRRYPAGTRPEFYAQRDWAKFRADLQSAADARAAPLDELTDGLAGLVGKMRSDNLENILLKRWQLANGEMASYAARFAPDFSKVDTTLCSVSESELRRRHDVAERGLTDAVRAFIFEYQASLELKRKDNAGNVVGEELTLADREALVSAISTSFMPWTKTAVGKDSFSSAAKFETAYVGSAATGDLVADAIKAAQANALDTPTCKTLMTD